MRSRGDDELTAAIMAYLAQAGKEGWALVPVEPTRDRLDALAADKMERDAGVDADLMGVAKIASAQKAAAQNGGE